MIRLHAEQLFFQLQKKILHPCYLLFGNDSVLLGESQDRILGQAQIQKFDEHFSVILDAVTNWDEIFSLCQIRSLFAIRKTLLIVLPDNGINNPFMAEKMLQLSSMLHDDMLLILRGSKLTRTTESSAWFRKLSQNAVLVSCVMLESVQLPHWVMKRAMIMKLILDDAACQLLCYCYEGNLPALIQVLERLSLIYPDRNLTLPRVLKAVNDAAHFTLFHWVEAVLLGKSKRATHILHQLHLENTNPMTLLRGIQREVLLLLTLKRQIADIPLHTMLDYHKVWQNRRLLLTQAIGRLTLTQLQDTVMLMTKIEVSFKQDYNYLVWSDLDALALLLCGKSLPTVMFDV